MIRAGDRLLFKFGGNRLQQEPGIYAAARVTRAPVKKGHGPWVLRYRPDTPLTRRLIRPNRGQEPRATRASVFRRLYPGRPGRPGPGRAVLSVLLGDADPPNRKLTHGLLILKEPLDKILAGTKTWEIRAPRCDFYTPYRRGGLSLFVVECSASDNATSCLGAWKVFSSLMPP